MMQKNFTILKLRATLEYPTFPVNSVGTSGHVFGPPAPGEPSSAPLENSNGFGIIFLRIEIG